MEASLHISQHAWSHLLLQPFVQLTMSGLLLALLSFLSAHPTEPLHHVLNHGIQSGQGYCISMKAENPTTQVETSAPEKVGQWWHNDEVFSCERWWGWHTGVLPTAIPCRVAALTSTLLYPTAMLLYAWPPAFFKAAKRVSPQSSVNYTQTVKFRVQYCHSHKMHFSDVQSWSKWREFSMMSYGWEKKIPTCPITPSHRDPIRARMSSTLRIVLFSVQTCIQMFMRWWASRWGKQKHSKSKTWGFLSKPCTTIVENLYDLSLIITSWPV